MNDGNTQFMTQSNNQSINQSTHAPVPTFLFEWQTVHHWKPRGRRIPAQAIQKHFAGRGSPFCSRTGATPATTPTSQVLLEGARNVILMGFWGGGVCAVGLRSPRRHVISMTFCYGKCHQVRRLWPDRVPPTHTQKFTPYHTRCFSIEPP